MSIPFAPTTQAWLHAAASAVDAFERQLDSDGRLPGALHDLGSYYKWPLALWSLSRVDLSRKVFATLVRDFMKPGGDFRTGKDKSGDPLYGLIADSYTNTWPLVAARALDRPDVAGPGLDCLRGRRVAAGRASGW